MSDSVLIGPPLYDRELVIEKIRAHLLRGGPELAATCGTDQASWEEFGARTVLLAKAMIDRGVASGDQVVICLPRSVDLIVGIVATQLIGAAYVPVDVTYPPSRISLIIGKSDAQVGLMEPESISQVSKPIIPSLLDTLGDAEKQSFLQTSGELTSGLGQSASYLVFTSGSTGEPRGVRVSHDNLAFSTNSRAQVYSDAPNSFLLLSSIAFDSSIVGLFWTLCNGGHLVVPTEQEAHDPRSLIRILSSGAIHYTLCVPTLYQALLHGWAGDPNSNPSWPRHVIVAGEACPMGLARDHFKFALGSELTNEYGPTETSVWVTAHHLEPSNTVVPIGPPIAGTWTAVVDDSTQPVPLGSEGELIIGGFGLTEGYYKNEDATRRKFGECTFTREYLHLGDHVGGRFFRTGDKVAILDGTLVFKGRTDYQMNLGGVRAEPEEVEQAIVGNETVIGAIAQIRDVRTLDELMSIASEAELRQALELAADKADPAAALLDQLRAIGAEDLRIVAHLESISEIDVSRLRKAVAAVLPPLLRPAIYIRHEALPRTPNGKLDRQAALVLPIVPLAEPVVVQSLLPNVSEEGTNEDLKGLVLDIFRETLRLPTLASSDSFFDSGGHSLTAMEAALRIERETGMEITIPTMYEYPTASELGTYLSRLALRSEVAPISVVARGELEPRPERISDRGLLSVAARSLVTAGERLARYAQKRR